MAYHFNDRTYICPKCGGDCGRCNVCDDTGWVRVDRHDAHDLGLERAQDAGKAPRLLDNAEWLRGQVDPLLARYVAGGYRSEAA